MTASNKEGEHTNQDSDRPSVKGNAGGKYLRKLAGKPGSDGTTYESDKAVGRRSDSPLHRGYVHDGSGQDGVDDTEDSACYDDRDDRCCRGSDTEAHVGKVNSQQQKHSKQSRYRPKTILQFRSDNNRSNSQEDTPEKEDESQAMLVHLQNKRRIGEQGKEPEVI